MQLTMPVKHGDDVTTVGRSHALTIVLGKAHKVYYYFGLHAPHDPSVPVPTLHTTDFSPKGIRQVLLTRGRQQPAPIVLIKANGTANYQDMVNILDEMNITDQKKYALTDLTAADRQLLPAAEQR